MLRTPQNRGNSIASAGEELRTAPALPSVSFVPVAVKASDIALAAVIAAQLPANERFPDPAALERLACGPVSPGTAAQLAVDFANKQHAWVAAHESVDGSVTGAIPGPVGEVLGGAWDATKSAEGLLAAGATDLTSDHPERIEHAVESSAEFLVEHPLSAAEHAVDWNDFSHGRVFKAIGEVGVEALLAKGAGKLAFGGSKAAAVASQSPAEAETLIRLGATIVKVPHVGDAAPILAQLTNKATIQAVAQTRGIAETAVSRALGAPDLPRLSETLVQPPAVVIRQAAPKAT